LHALFPSRPLQCLTAEQRALIRPGDSVVIFETHDNRRNPHLQGNKPPWKRRPWRFVENGRAYELQRPDGTWERFEPGWGSPGNEAQDDAEPVMTVLHFEDNGFGDPVSPADDGVAESEAEIPPVRATSPLLGKIQ
jgi:hypothetical protein